MKIDRFPKSSCCAGDYGRAYVVPEDCDLDYVAEAQYVFEFFDVENCIGPVDPLKITAVAGVDPQAVLAVMQLEAIPVPDEDEE